MCFQCTEQFREIERLPAFEAFDVEPTRNHGYELTATGLDTVHESAIRTDHRPHTHGHGTHSHAHGDRVHTHGNRNTRRTWPAGHPGPHRRGLSDRSIAGRTRPDAAGEVPDDGHHFFTDGGAEYAAFEPDRSKHEARLEAVEVDGYENLLEAARTVLEKERAIYTTSMGQVREAGARPGAGYDMADGTYERALLVVEPNYDHRVYEAFAEALREKGTAVDVVIVGRITGEIDVWEHELPGVHEGKVQDHPLLMTTGVRWWEDFVDDEDRYDLLVYGSGGPPRSLDGVDYERIPWRNEVDLVSPGTFFPTDLWNLINRKTAAFVSEAETVRLTDAEGTDLTFTNYNHEYTTRGYPGHVFGHPVWLTDRADTSGVVAGTLNHAGAFPRIEVEVDDAKVVDVRGGGRYGQLWREMLDETEGIQYPGLPGPGLFHLIEVAIGTNPKVSRPTVDDIRRVQFPEMDRRRSGVIHCGFGCYYDIEPWAAEIKDVPWGHVHVHLNFPTYEAEMPDGESRTLIDEGRLTVLDDPAVREKAGEYGDPDDLLAEDWIPAVPGISTEGTYDTYARDPMAWIHDTRSERATE